MLIVQINELEGFYYPAKIQHGGLILKGFKYQNKTLNSNSWNIRGRFERDDAFNPVKDLLIRLFCPLRDFFR